MITAICYVAWFVSGCALVGEAANRVMKRFATGEE